MFGKLRRTAQAIDKAECEEVLRLCTHGVLALAGEDGYPYAVPLSHMYEDGKLYFHCAGEGYKMRAIRGDDRASFCAVADDDVIPEKLTTAYRSVIVFGRIRELPPGEKRAVLERYARRFAPDLPVEEITAEIDESFESVCVLELGIEQMTGKIGREIMTRRNIEK